MITELEYRTSLLDEAMREYTERVIQANEDVQDMWDEVFPLAIEHGYVEDGISALTLGVSYRSVRFDVPEPSPEPVSDPAEAGEAQNE